MKKLIWLPLAFVMWGCATQKEAKTTTVNEHPEHVHNWVIKDIQNNGTYFTLFYRCLPLDTLRYCPAEKQELKFMPQIRNN